MEDFCWSQSMTTTCERKLPTVPASQYDHRPLRYMMLVEIYARMGISCQFISWPFVVGSGTITIFMSIWIPLNHDIGIYLGHTSLEIKK